MADYTGEEETIQDIKQRITDALEKWKAIGATPIPKTLKEARENSWELASDAVEVGAILSYPKEQQDAESRRVIRLEKAIEIVDTFEAEMISHLVIRPGNILGTLKGVIEEAATVLYNGVALLFRYSNLRKALWGLFREMLKHIFLTAGAGLLIAAVVRVAKSRQSIEKEMRRKALPQSMGPRYVRRKTSSR